MTFTARFSTAADWLLSLRNVNDVQAAYEPTVTQIEQQKLGHRWLSISDVDPQLPRELPRGVGQNAEVAAGRHPPLS